MYRASFYLFLILTFAQLFQSSAQNPFSALWHKITHSLPAKEEQFDWDNLADFQQLRLDPALMAEALKKLEYWGVAHSYLQYHGLDGQDPATTQWHAWEEKLIAEGRLTAQDKLGAASLGSQHYKEDIKRAAEAGMTMWRISLDWALIEKEPGVYDDTSIKKVADFINCLCEHNIMPMLTFFHHSPPLWIYKLEGAYGFENEVIILLFAQYCLYAFETLLKYIKPEYHEKLHYLLTFNEPAAYTVAGYVGGQYPPGNRLAFKKASRCILNMLRAHTHARRQLQERYPHLGLKISLAHAINPLHPHNPWNPLERLACWLIDDLLNNSTIEYFRTGKFNCYGVKSYDPEAIGALDYGAICYYTREVMKQVAPFKSPFKLVNTIRETDIAIECAHSFATEPRAIYAEGLLDAIKRISRLEKPIFIVENGCATDTTQGKNVELLKTSIERHLLVVALALSLGFDIQGYLRWTAIDGYNWGQGDTNCKAGYGIWQIDWKDPNYPRSLRPGNEFMLAVFKRLKEITLAPENR
jgi:beta-glucosidase